MQKKVFFIPTKGQTEQEYLAIFLEIKKLAPFSSEEKFNIKLLIIRAYFLKKLL